MKQVDCVEEDIAIKEQRKDNLKKAKSRDPALNQVTIEKDGTIKIETVNIRSVQAKYYIINAELLFSRSPFLKDNTEGFSYVMPIETVQI